MAVWSRLNFVGTTCQRAKRRAPDARTGVASFPWLNTKAQRHEDIGWRPELGRCDIFLAVHHPEYLKR